MSIYDDTGSGDLYDSGEARQGAPQSPPAQPQQPAAPKPSDVASKALQVIADPLGSAAALLPTDPGEVSKIPWGFAVLGACVAAMFWASSFDGRKK